MFLILGNVLEKLEPTSCGHFLKPGSFSQLQLRCGIKVGLFADCHAGLAIPEEKPPTFGNFVVSTDLGASDEVAQVGASVAGHPRELTPALQTAQQP